MITSKYKKLKIGIFPAYLSINFIDNIDNNYYAYVTRIDNNITVTLDNNIHTYKDDILINILAHESTHVFQEMCAYIIESKPGDEIEAYHIGTITQYLYNIVQKEKVKAQLKKGESND